jgi:hypothetical protein
MFQESTPGMIKTASGQNILYSSAPFHGITRSLQTFPYFFLITFIDVSLSSLQVDSSPAITYARHPLPRWDKKKTATVAFTLCTL